VAGFTAAVSKVTEEYLAEQPGTGTEL
jgi:hypothetical protein